MVYVQQANESVLKLTGDDGRFLGVRIGTVFLPRIGDQCVEDFFYHYAYDILSAMKGSDGSMRQEKHALRVDRKRLEHMHKALNR